MMTISIRHQLGYRKVSDDGLEIDVNQETDGYFNLYADSISVSYLHSMNASQINAIHYFEENTEQIFITLSKHLLGMHSNPKIELGFKHVNILNEYQQDYCFTEYTSVYPFFIITKKSAIIYVICEKYKVLIRRSYR